MLSTASLPPLSLYVHFPWCVRKCPYCDFNSHAAKEAIPEEEYIAALLADLAQEWPDIQRRNIQSIFLGGGTPSLFSPSAMQHLLSVFRQMGIPVDAIEVTMEANPGTVEQEKFNAFREIGINRLSIGIQSFADEKLKGLGRIHDGEEASRAIETAKHAGFDNFNLDLMFGLPGQTLQQATQDLHTAINAHPTHISYYQLTLEPNTIFARYPPTLPDDDDIAEMQRTGNLALSSAGYEQYEVSAFGQVPCQHNLNYWNFGDYIGIGAGAHGKWTCPSTRQVRRYAKQRHPADYLRTATSRDVVQRSEQVATKQLIFEFMLNALRLYNGFPLSLFEERCTSSRYAILPIIDHALERGLITVRDDRIGPTPRGRRFWNDLVARFLPEHEG